MNTHSILLLIHILEHSLRTIQSCQWSPEQCGCWFNQTNTGFSEKIVGGFESAPHSWPWIVSIRKRTSKQPFGLPICGGTLISAEHILTAAHCFYEDLVNEKKSIEMYLFIIGAHYSTNTHVYSDTVIRQTASFVILHEKYHSRRQTDDIALVQLKEKVPLENMRLGKICLPNESDMYPPHDTHTVALGWGRLSENAKKGSDTLQQVVLVIEEGPACDRIKAGKQIQTQLCAGSIDPYTSQDTCQGDSGGPLMTRTTDGLWELVGVTSYGKGCGRLGELGVYTRVSMYVDWITIEMKNSEGRTLRSSDNSPNVFSNSMNIHQNNVWIIFYLIMVYFEKKFVSYEN